MKLCFVITFLATTTLQFWAGVIAFAQPAVLKANGPGDTYELINSVFAPGYDVVENPECVHGAFGRHIAEVWDAGLNAFVFEFYSHVAQDNDRCISFDRQRIEIKTYDKSPDSLIGTRGETITYKWLFKIPVGFKASSNFTHIHQIKPVNGDDGDPLFTLTVRKGNPNKLELIHDNRTKVVIVNLSLFEGEWVEATEVIKVGGSGTYSMLIRRLSDNATLISYSNANLLTIRSDNDFIRPKWGIYRSLLNAQDLRDDAIRFNGFSIEEGEKPLAVSLMDIKAVLIHQKVEISWIPLNESISTYFLLERSQDGQLFNTVERVNSVGNTSVSPTYKLIDPSPLTGHNFYRIKQVDAAGQNVYSKISAIQFHPVVESVFRIYPNPVHKFLQIQLYPVDIIYHAVVSDILGRSIISCSGTPGNLSNTISLKLDQLKTGMYFIKIASDHAFYSSRFYKN